MHAPSPTGPRRLRLGLRARLAVAIAGLALLLAALFRSVVVPDTAATFRRHGDELLRASAIEMAEISAQLNEAATQALLDQARTATAQRLAALQELPAAVQQGSAAALREALAAAETARQQAQQREARQLAAALQRDAEARIERRFRELEREQAARTARFASAEQQRHLELVLALALGLLAVLGLGVHLAVVRPARRLAAAARAVQGGDLDVALPRPGGDELGRLAADFAAMTAELRRSRAQVQQLTAGLADEVAKKTAHLQQALAELRDSTRQLAQAERLAALGTLAGGIAHEFHNLIGGIRGCAAELRAVEPAADRRETLDVILRAADRATGIVQQLLRFARRSVEVRAPLDPAAVAEDALRLCEPAARRQGVRVERDLARGVTVHGDADGLHQVLVNLLTNALQAMPAGGTLRVRVAAAGDGARIAVADTGHGIAAADLPHLFEPFFTTRRDPGDHTRRGTGLGLSVSYGIVAAHGGRLEVASAEGQGSTFTVHLPGGAGAGAGPDPGGDPGGGPAA